MAGNNRTVIVKHLKSFKFLRDHCLLDHLPPCSDRDILRTERQTVAKSSTIGSMENSLLSSFTDIGSHFRRHVCFAFSFPFSPIL